MFADSWLEDSGGIANLDQAGRIDLADLSILVSQWGDTGVRLVINEFMADNVGTIEDPDEAGEYADWIELYNYGSTPIDTGGMYLQDDTTTFQIPSTHPAQTTIPPGGFLLIWADDDPEQGPLHTNFKLGAGGDAIRLTAADGTLIDQKVFGSQGIDASTGRFPNGGSAWQVFGNGTATPGRSNGGESADTGILIHEIMYHPGHNELTFEPEPVALEYIELYNAGTTAVNLGGWRLVDGVDFQMPADTFIGANDTFVIAADAARFAQAYPAVANVVGGWTGKLNNQGETITLVNAIGTVIDTVAYSDEGQWAQRILGPLEYQHRGWEWSDAHDGGGRSLELINPSLSNAYGRNWQASQIPNGTPGRANSLTATDTAPIILKIAHSPAIPSSDQAVTVTAEVIDEAIAGVSVSLLWRVDTSTYVQSQYPTYNPASYTTVTMYDDGLHGDAQAGDGLFGATIPPQADKTVVEFFVRASDAAAHTRTYPAPCDIDGQMQQTANCLYLTDNSFDPAILTAEGANPVYYLIMTESERGRLADIGNEQSGDNNERYCRAQMNGTFIAVVDSTIHCRYSMGYRDRGEGSSGTPPNNFRINFCADAPFEGATALNCNSKYTFLQTAGSQLYRAAGLHATATVPVRLYVNGSQPALTDPSRTYGYYAAFRPYDGDWLEEYVLNAPGAVAGNIYKASSGSWHADLTYRGTTPAAYATAGYSKSNNASENDWSDLFQLTSVLSDTTAPDYAERVGDIIDIPQWMRWFAMCTLIGYNENGLATSRGDDYVMYRTGDTQKFQLLIYDLDTVLHVAHGAPPLNRSIFYAADRDSTYMPLLDALFAQPEFIQVYYEQLQDLIETVYPAEALNPLLDQSVKGWVPDAMLAEMKSLTAQRVQQVLLQIPLTFSIQSALPVVNGYAQTTAASASLSGRANAVTTHSVYVNGVAASWDPIRGQWSAAAVGLLPGINRVVVETYGTPDDSGTVLERGTFDIWYLDGTESVLSGTLTADQTLTAAAGPWHVTTDVVIPSGRTLTIEPGATVFFDDGTGITVNGRLVAAGTAYRHIRLTRTPGASRWDGVSFINTLADSRMDYADMEYGDQQGESVLVQSSRVSLSFMTWASTNGATRVLELTHPSAVIRGCVLPTVSGTETVHGTGLSGAEYLIFDGNTFGSTTGYNDIVDFTGGQRPGPIVQFYNNTFLGGGDDGPDLDTTDAHVEGNLFTHFHQTTADQDSPSYAVATGDQSQVCIVRNVFVDNDHAILHKENVFSWTQNNTIINCGKAAVSFGEPFRSTPREPGKGSFLDSNIFWNNAAIFEHYFDNPPDYGPTGAVGVYRSLLPSAQHSFGVGNVDADPLLTDPLRDWTLLAGSPAKASGANGQDMGAGVEAGASVSGEPDAVTYRTSATLTAAGPGITHYRYRLVDNGAAGAWSGEIALPINSDDFPADPDHVTGQIALTGLQDGHSYRVDVAGKNSAGLWQGQPFGATGFTASGNAEGNSSRTWRVDTSSRILVINEALAENRSIDHDGTYPDMIELYYDGAAPLDLGGYRLTDNREAPDKFVFAAGTMMNPGDHLVIYADADSAASGIHAGFSLDADGDDLTLLNAEGVVVDSVTFGMQLADLSIGRISYERRWALTTPTFGAANQGAATGDWRQLKINEWLAAEDILFEDDMVELYNPSPWPAELGGLCLTDNPVGEPGKHRLRALSFVAGSGFAVLTADGDGGAGANHLNFKLNSGQGHLGLFDADLTLLDQVSYYQQKTDVSQGRMPDGGPQTGFFDLPTPGAANMNLLTTVTRHDLVAMDGRWSYDQSGTEPDITWREAGFDDGGWPTGAALLYVEGSSLPAPKNTPLTLGKTTYYFRTHFTFDGDPSAVDRLEFTTVIDDGAVVYLNGVEVQKIRLSGTVSYGTWATSIDNAVLESFSVPSDALLNGDNVLAVEVHQTSSSSTDIVFGLSLEAVSITTQIDDLYADSRAILDALRITEILYHPASDPDTEFIELQNIGDAALSLGGVRFTAGIDFVFPPMTLEPGGCTVVVADQAVFESRYGTQIPVAGTYSGRLDNAGETIVLTLAEPLDAAVLRFAYKDGWHPTTDGGGFSLVIVDPAGPPADWQEARRWRPGLVAGGSPGREDRTLVTINEVLAHSHDTASDWIELYNPTDGPVDVGGWYLSDDADAVMKYRIAADTVIASQDYLVLYETLHFANPADAGCLVPFALSENGDAVYLSAGENGMVSGYTVESAFGASDTNVSFGHYEKSDGTAAFVSLSETTPGQPNAAPKTGPVVISEILYNPPAGGSFAADEYEYIELRNITDEAAVLQAYDPSLGVTLGWQFSAGIDFTFPLGVTLPAHGTLVIARNPAAFAERYGSAGAAAVLGPFENDTKLSNSGELLELSKPGDTDLEGLRHYIRTDSVLFGDQAPWPTAPDGAGQALDRIDDAAYGDDAVNWQAQPPAPGV